MKTIEKQSLILNCYVPNIILLSILVLSIGASGGLCYSVFSFRVVFCRLVFVLFLLAIEFSILLYTASDYPFGIFKLVYYLPQDVAIILFDISSSNCH
jgi:hypothetical protein